MFNLLLTGVGLIAAGLVPFGFNLAVGHQDGAAILGRVAIALNLGLFLGQIPGTISGAATKFIAEALGEEQPEKAERVFRFLLVVTIGLSIAMGFSVIAASSLLESTFKLQFATIALTAALVPAYALYLYFKSSYYGFQRVRTYLFNEIVSDALFFVALIAAFLMGATSWLLLPFVLNNVIFAFIACRDLAPQMRRTGRMTAAERRTVINYCLWNGGGSAASLSRWTLGTVIAGWFLAAHQVGLFAAAVAITMPLSLLPRAISLVTFALMARLHGAGESESVRNLLQHSTEWLVFLLGVPSGLAIINADRILTFFFGSAFVPAATATQLIILGAYITDISRPSIDALSSTRHVRIATAASFAGLAVSLVLWLALIPHFGIGMAGLGFAGGAAVTALIPAFAAIKFIGTDPIVFIRPAIMLAALWVITLFAGHYALAASVLFAGGMCILYKHLLQDGFRYASGLAHARLSLQAAR